MTALHAQQFPAPFPASFPDNSSRSPLMLPTTARSREAFEQNQLEPKGEKYSMNGNSTFFARKAKRDHGYWRQTMLAATVAWAAFVPVEGFAQQSIQVRAYHSTKDAAKLACESGATGLGYFEDYWCNASSIGSMGDYTAGWLCRPRDYPFPTCNRQENPAKWTFYLLVHLYGPVTPKNMGGNPVGSCPTGNPINTAIGNKFQTEVVYSDTTSSALNFTAYYNSSFASKGVFYNTHWRHTYDRALVPDGIATGTIINAYRPDGKYYTFNYNAATDAWAADADAMDALVQIKDTSGQLIQQRYTSAADETEVYDAAGKLTSIAYRNGLTQTLVYDASGVLQTVTDSFGRALTFAKDGSQHIGTMTDPAGGLHTFAYNAQNNLISIGYPDLAVRTYLYELGNVPNALTGIADENGARYASFAYDLNGNAISTEHAGGVDKYVLSLSTDGSSTTVTDPLGTTRTHTFQSIHGVSHSTGISQPAGSGCSAAANNQTYDANGNIASRTDFNGSVTTYAYDLSRNLETQRIEASGTPEARTVSTVWHPDWRLATRVAEPKKLTTHVYNGQPDPSNGNALLTCAPTDALVIDKPIAVLCKTIEQATTDADGSQAFAATSTGTPRTNTWTWSRTGQMLTADGPRTDVADITTYAYWPGDATCPGAELGTGRDKGCRGQLQQVTDPLGQMTQYTRYNAHGQLEESIDPNGLVTTQTYDLRQRLTGQSPGSETTSWTYDPVGQLKRLSLPDGDWTDYTYDDAHRLIRIADKAGNHIDYTLDNAGHRIGEDTFDATGTLVTTLTRAYDALGRVQGVSGALAP